MRSETAPEGTEAGTPLGGRPLSGLLPGFWGPSAQELPPSQCLSLPFFICMVEMHTQ